MIFITFKYLFWIFLNISNGILDNFDNLRVLNLYGFLDVNNSISFVFQKFRTSVKK